MNGIRSNNFIGIFEKENIERKADSIWGNLDEIFLAKARLSS